MVSFFLLFGRCRYCQSRISLQYPLVEFAGALLLAFVFLKYQKDIALLTLPIKAFILFFIRDTFFLSTLLLLFVYDLRYYLILDRITFPAIIITFCLNLFSSIPAYSMLLSAFILSGFFLLQYILSKGRWIGGGDIRLGFLIGIMLSWPSAISALLSSYILGAIISLFLVGIKAKQWESVVPYGAFLSATSMIQILFGSIIFFRL
jgi:prepilin signal peptidase PulO-like enzyme (type II secretory pathway)